MGALHAGHVSLIEASRSECSFNVVSIFVNPTQFAPHEDLSRYPRPREADLEKCAAAGADLVFYPAVEEMYPPDAVTTVDVAGLTQALEGAIRPTHFRGVTTVVAKLFGIVQPDYAFFGQKDFQQQAVIRRMVRDLDLPVEVRVCPTIRDADGLALSSRNVYLSADERQAGLCLSRALRKVTELVEAGETHPRVLQQVLAKTITDTVGVVLDYAVIVDPESLAPVSAPQRQLAALVAAKVGTTRLLDNTYLLCAGVSLK